MKEKIKSSQTEIRKSTINHSGYGVFASKNFKKGEIIEECPCLPLSENVLHDFNNHLFSPDGNKTVLPLGHGCLYQHTELPNAAWVFDENNQLITFEALKNIPKEHEIFIYYSPQWFSSRGTQPSLPYKRTKKFLSILARIGFIAMLFGIFMMALLPPRAHVAQQKFPKNQAFTHKPTPIR